MRMDEDVRVSLLTLRGQSKGWANEVQTVLSQICHYRSLNVLTMYVKCFYCYSTRWSALKSLWCCPKHWSCSSQSSLWELGCRQKNPREELSRWIKPHHLLFAMINARYSCRLKLTYILQCNNILIPFYRGAILPWLLLRMTCLTFWLILCLEKKFSYDLKHKRYTLQVPL